MRLSFMPDCMDYKILLSQLTTNILTFGSVTKSRKNTMVALVTLEIEGQLKRTALWDTPLHTLSSVVYYTVCKNYFN